MELKISCDCGQKYVFDVEPVNNRMPSPVNCPSCGGDGTSAANRLIAQTVAPPSPPPSRFSLAPIAAPRQPLVMPELDILPSLSKPKPKSAAKEYSLGRGLLGAFLGAGLGVAILIGFAMCFHFIFPFSGVLLGVLAGYGARILFKGTSTTLGLLTAAIAILFYGALLVLLLGPAAIGSVISIVLCVVTAWRIASG